MKKLKLPTCVGLFLVAFGAPVFADFQNFDFESANMQGHSVNEGIPIPISDALLGWKGYYGGEQEYSVVYDSVSLSSSSISIFDNKTSRPYVFSGSSGIFW